MNFWNRKRIDQINKENEKVEKKVIVKLINSKGLYSLKFNNIEIFTSEGSGTGKSTQILSSLNDKIGKNKIYINTVGKNDYEKLIDSMCHIDLIEWNNEFSILERLGIIQSKINTINPAYVVIDEMIINNNIASLLFFTDKYPSIKFYIAGTYHNDFNLLIDSIYKHYKIAWGWRFYYES